MSGLELGAANDNCGDRIQRLAIAQPLHRLTQTARIGLAGEAGTVEAGNRAAQPLRLLAVGKQRCHGGPFISRSGGVLPVPAIAAVETCRNCILSRSHSTITGTFSKGCIDERPQADTIATRCGAGV